NSASLTPRIPYNTIKTIRNAPYTRNHFYTTVPQSSLYGTRKIACSLLTLNLLPTALSLNNTPSSYYYLLPLGSTHRYGYVVSLYQAKSIPNGTSLTFNESALHLMPR
ncbi:hypothetical protein WUBG_19247, partial [Wuchereria bancrofti]